MRVKHHTNSAFTLIEIMIVVAIIGLLAAVAIPNLTKATKQARKTACIQNLKTIDGAKKQWALENKKGDDDTPSEADLVGDDKYMEKKPECPAGGTYNFGSVGVKPTCTVAEHAL